jgi:hypothetical protein
VKLVTSAMAATRCTWPLVAWPTPTLDPGLQIDRWPIIVMLVWLPALYLHVDVLWLEVACIGSAVGLLERDLLMCVQRQHTHIHPRQPRAEMLVAVNIAIDSTQK